jgi:hypothetical protein
MIPVEYVGSVWCSLRLKYLNFTEPVISRIAM